ncbi:MAG TPA: hypothetical protein VHY77_00175 [Acidimicrobiales bacterium]|nr:hypothetical protein [Acidimicrobiales bacterium]
MGRHRALGEQTAELLAGLGTSRGEVAASLCDAGVWGTRNDPRCCAVASYLGAVLGADPRVRSLTTGQSQVKIIVNGRVRLLPSSVVRVPLPPSVAQFIVAFDRGVYPMLVRGPAGSIPQQSESASS